MARGPHPSIRMVLESPAGPAPGFLIALALPAMALLLLRVLWRPESSHQEQAKNCQ
jgi:hypothetical protein